jgi:uncharacterized membrane protein YdjX (TVP38/TMEM64 family)
MAGWYPTRTTMNTTLSRSTKAVIAVALLAVGLVAAVPVVFIVALLMMLFGHVVGGLILIGGAVLVATAAVSVAALCGVRKVRHIREMMTGDGFRTGRVLRLDANDYDSF